MLSHRLISIVGCQMLAGNRDFERSSSLARCFCSGVADGELANFEKYD